MFRVITFFPLEREDLIRAVEEVLTDEEIKKIAGEKTKVIGLMTKAVCLESMTLESTPGPGRMAQVILKTEETMLSFKSVDRQDTELVSEIISMMEKGNSRLVEKLKELKKALKNAEIEVKNFRK